MTSNQIIWNKNGLFYSDNKFDYLLNNNNNIKINSLKESTMQRTSLYLNNSNKYLSIYNNGIDPDSKIYLDEAVITDNGISISSVININSNTIANCDDNIYAVSPDEDLSKYEGEIQNTDDQEIKSNTIKLISVYENNKFTNKEISRSETYNAIGNSKYSQCKDNIFYYYNYDISNIKEPSPIIIKSLDSWNIITGEYKSVPLKYENIDNSDLNLGRLKNTDKSLIGEYIFSYNEFGEIYKTNIYSGDVKKVASISDKKPENSYTTLLSDMDGKDLISFIFNESNDYYFVQYSINQEKMINKIKIIDLKKSVNYDNIPWGFAVNPNR
jgi:hypothetical protein